MMKAKICLETMWISNDFVLNLRDYRENERLDRYDLASADGEEFEQMDMTTRQLVEAKLKRRDRERARLEGRLPPAFLDDGLLLFFWKKPTFLYRGRRR